MVSETNTKLLFLHCSLGKERFPFPPKFPTFLRFHLHTFYSCSSTLCSLVVDCELLAQCAVHTQLALLWSHLNPSSLAIGSCYTFHHWPSLEQCPRLRIILCKPGWTIHKVPGFPERINWTGLISFTFDLASRPIIGSQTEFFGGERMSKNFSFFAPIWVPQKFISSELERSSGTFYVPELIGVSPPAVRVVSPLQGIRPKICQLEK